MKHLIPEFEKLRARYPAGFESSLVLPCLRRIQEDRGFVADSDIDALVKYLGVPRIQIEEVLSFYGQFRRKPIGRCHIQACRNISCSLLGAERILDHLTNRLGIAPGQTTADGRYTLSTGRVPGRVRDRAGADDQRHLPREHDARKDRRAARDHVDDLALTWRTPAPDDLSGHRYRRTRLPNIAHVAATVRWRKHCGR
jgi:NADH-quinone oxidoreductase subunit E